MKTLFQGRSDCDEAGISRVPATHQNLPPGNMMSHATTFIVAQRLHAATGDDPKPSGLSIWAQGMTAKML